MNVATAIVYDVEAILAHRFRVGTSPRSAEYRAGVRAILEFRLTGGAHIHCPAPLGTAAADAFGAGVDEGHFLSRIALGLQP